MKIFISWSGLRSKAVAELLRDWIKILLQATDPWLSTRDIDRGSIWFNEIQGQLGDSSVGIVCLTPENRNNPWILFESGALAKGLSANRVCTILLDLDPSAIDPPLAQFNHTRANREDMLKLVKDINKWVGERSLSDAHVEKAFAMYWPDFEGGIAKARSSITQHVEEKRPTESVLYEILEHTRALSKHVTELEPMIMDAITGSGKGSTHAWIVPKLEAHERSKWYEALKRAVIAVRKKEDALGRSMTQEQIRAYLDDF